MRFRFMTLVSTLLLASAQVGSTTVDITPQSSTGTAWTANPDGASLVNGLAYDLGLNRQVFDPNSFLTQFTHDGKAWARYQIPLDPAVSSSGLGLGFSFDLVTWYPAATSFEGTVVANRTSTFWMLEVSNDDHQRAYIRLNTGTQPG